MPSESPDSQVVKSKKKEKPKNEPILNSEIELELKEPIPKTEIELKLKEPIPNTNNVKEKEVDKLNVDVKLESNGASSFEHAETSQLGSDEKQHSRYGRIRKNRSLGPDMQVTPLVKPKLKSANGSIASEDSPKKEESLNSVKKTSVYPSFSKTKVEKIMKDLAMSITEELTLGDLIWARIPGHPFWPCMISKDPVKKDFVKLRKKKNSKEGGFIYHVHYFGKGFQRGWTVPNGIMLFKGKDHFHDFVKSIADKSSDEHKDVVHFVFRVPQSRLTTWKAAVVEAEKSILLTREERLNLLASLVSQSQPESSLANTPKKENDLNLISTGLNPVNLVEAIRKSEIHDVKKLEKGVDESEPTNRKDKVEETKDTEGVENTPSKPNSTEVVEITPSKLNSTEVVENLPSKLNSTEIDSQLLQKDNSISKYKDKTYFEHYLNRFIYVIMKQSPTLSNKMARDILASRWETLSHDEKLSYKKRKGDKVSDIKIEDSFPKSTLSCINNVQSKSGTENIKDYSKSIEVSKAKAVMEPTSKIKNQVNNNIDKSLDSEVEKTTYGMIKKERISPSDFTSLLTPNKNGESPRKVAVFLVDSDSDSDFSIDETVLPEDKGSKTDSQNNSVEVCITRLPVELNKEGITKVDNAEKPIALNKEKSEDKSMPKLRNTKMLDEIDKDKFKSQSISNESENGKPKNKIIKSKDKDDSELTKPSHNDEDKSKPNLRDRNVKKSNKSEDKTDDEDKTLNKQNSKEKLNDKVTKSVEKPVIIPQIEYSEGKEIKDAIPSCAEIKDDNTSSDFSLYLSEPTDGSVSALASPVPSTISVTPIPDEEQRNEIIESVGLKKISPTDKDEVKTGRIGTRRYVKSRMDEADNKSRKNEEQFNEVKFPTDNETGDESGPPNKKNKTNDSASKNYMKPKSRQVKNKTSNEDKKKSVEQPQDKLEANQVEEMDCKSKPLTNGLKDNFEETNDLIGTAKTVVEEMMEKCISDSKDDHRKKESSKSLTKTKSVEETKSKGKVKSSKNKEKSTSETAATGASNDKTPIQDSNKLPSSKAKKAVLKNSNSESNRKRKALEENIDSSFNKYIHQNIWCIMGENPAYSYTEAKAVLVTNWVKMSDEEKSSYQPSKEDMKENVKKTTTAKKAKLSSKSLEGIESEEEELQTESIDGDNNTASNRHERLCQICEVSGDVVTCKGPCQQNFHLGCLTSKPEDLSSFQCDECLNNCHTCFSCKSNNGEVRKCTISNCGKFYHDACLRKSPLSTVMEHRIICPLHVCLSCYNESPKFARSHRGRLVRCIRCPTAFHSVEGCVGAGSIQLTQSHILCTHHFTPKKTNKHHSHVNVSWCFICSAGGELICCESCPGAFHAECLDIIPPEGSYYCQDCKHRKHPTSGNIVWVKLGCYRWWPAEVCHPNNVPINIQKIEHSVGEFPVRFFGSHDYFWVHKGRVFLFHEGDKGSSDGTSNRYLAKVFHKAVEEATSAFKKWQQSKRNREINQNSSKPPSYKHIKVNRPIGKVQIHVADLASLTRCECDPKSEIACARDTDCLNRLLHLECHPNVCPAGEKCMNQDFVKRNYAPASPLKVEGRGWGLFSKGPILKGQFVSEYVGELIDEEECQKRLRNMHAENDTNFYFLTIDKDRIIDAGPKGNFSRFMNHSCQPNCETQKWMVNGDTRVGLFATEDIDVGFELTFNYNLECRGDEKTKCGCGAPNCSGFIGVRPKTPAAINAEKKFKDNLGKKKKRKVNATRKHEDECYRCGEGGELLMCDKKGCTKSYHLFCLSLDKPPHGKWECPWHHCDSCGRSSTVLCQECPNSYCNVHATPDNIFEGSRALCSEHDIPEVSEEVCEKSPSKTEIETPS